VANLIEGAVGLHPVSGLPYVVRGGHMRVMGSLPDPTPKRMHLPKFTAKVNPIPRSQWKEFDEPDDHLWILDQDGHGSCVGHGSTSAFEVAWFQAGNKSQRFSPNYLYSLVNGGQDNGAVVGDAMDALVSKGVCLESTVPEGDVIYTRQMPATAAPEAARFRLGQCYRVATFDEIATAVICGFGVSIGVNWPSNDTPDKDGFMQVPQGSVGGHCLCLRLGMRQKAGKWYIKGQNSWGTSWGVGGHFFMSEEWFAQDTDHFVAEAPLLDPKDPDVPPVPIP
jgi:hypothetical protein